MREKERGREKEKKRERERKRERGIQIRSHLPRVEFMVKKKNQM